MNLTMFEKMQLLPLFQGLSIKELSEIVEWMKLDFYKLCSGDNVVSQGEKCSSIIFIISGTICAEYYDLDGRFILTETLESPLVLEPYNIYGMYQKYSRSYWMNSDGSSLVIPKYVFSELLRRYQIIRTNFMNTICTRLQYSDREARELSISKLRDKIVKAVLSVSSTRIGYKKIRIKMETLAGLIGETRLSVSHELNKMQRENLMKLGRGTIEIFEFEKLYTHTHRNR